MIKEKTTTVFNVTDGCMRQVKCTKIPLGWRRRTLPEAEFTLFIFPFTSVKDLLLRGSHLHMCGNAPKSFRQLWPRKARRLVRSLCMKDAIQLFCRSSRKLREETELRIQLRIFENIFWEPRSEAANTLIIWALIVSDLSKMNVYVNLYMFLLFSFSLHKRHDPPTPTPDSAVAWRGIWWQLATTNVVQVIIYNIKQEC